MAATLPDVPAASLQVVERVEAQSWYHTLELGPGLVTKGVFDLRPYVKHYALPERLDGVRALEVGTWDGFWAFELERRGADVTALDLSDDRELDWPPRRRPATYQRTRGEGFRLAREVLGSQVKRVECNIYDARPEELGTFDLVFCGSVLIHLRDQLLALERIAGLCTGRFISAEEYNRAAGLVPFPVSRYRADRDAAVVFWQPSARTWRRMMWTAGFDSVREVSRFDMRSTEGYSVRHVVHHAEK
jgi:tRNA (mo5U34)-methyltransferase